MNLTSPGTKKLIPALIIFLTLIAVIRCEEESPQPREYPRLTGTQVTNISDSGATFIADLYSLGTDTIIDHGFVWDYNPNPWVSEDNKIMLRVPAKPGLFSARISTTLTKEEEYYVKPFVQTTGRIIYGPEVRFISQGSNAPVIYGFEPDSAGWGDTIKVSGKNFSWVSYHNGVYINNVFCNSITSTDSTLFFFLHPNVTTIKNLISVRLGGSQATYDKKELKLILPRIEKISRESFFWRDTITITGKKLYNTNLPNINISATLGMNSCKIIEKKNDTLKIIAPDAISSIDCNLNIVMNGVNLVWPDKIRLESPEIKSVNPVEGKWGTTLELAGRFHPDASKNIFRVGAYQASITEFTKDSVKVKVPVSVSYRENLISLTANNLQVTASETFKLFAPVIKSIDPLYGPSGTNVKITGKYLYNGVWGYTKVKFGTKLASFQSINDSIINCSVPSGIPSGPVDITINPGNQYLIYGISFDIRNPVIIDFYPKSGTFDETVTIKGKYFKSSYSPYIRIANDIAYLVSITDSVIVAKVSRFVWDTIPQKVSVEIGYNLATSNESFNTLPPEIHSVNTTEINPGQDIVITGANFNPGPGFNVISWSGKQFSIKSSTKNEIIATVTSSGLIPGSARIQITVGGFKRYSPGYVIYK